MKEFIRHTILNAGRIVMDNFHNVKRVERKAGGGLLTEADTRSEDFIINAISKEFPDHSILAEESGEHRGGSVHKWIIDPLDGTTNFAHGFPWFCISIAYEYNGDIVMGAIYNPIANELFFAERGRGIYLNDKGIKVSAMTSLSEALLATGFYYFKGRELDLAVERFKKMKQNALAVRRMGSAALDLAFTAAGRFDGYWENGLSPWDVAAGFLMVKEAGGMVSNFNGEGYTIYGREILASNGAIHQSMVETLGS